MKLQRVLILKMSGEDVIFLQTKLKECGFLKERVDGFFGQNTLIAVTNFQREANIKVDGIVGPLTWNNLLNYEEKKRIINNSKIVTNQWIDIPNKVSFIGEDGLRIYDNLLTDDEYIKEETRKETIYLHNTGGGSRPDWTIGGWIKDFLKDENGSLILDENNQHIPLKVATSYVIGRKSSSTNDKIWDGKILRAFDDKYWAYHLGISSDDLNSKSIGIEICNYGPLTVGKDNRFYNSVNRPINDEDVVELDVIFRGYKFYEKYTDAQIESTYKLIKYLQSKWGIEIEKGIYNQDWFNYDEIWMSNGGLRSQSQIKKDTFDIFPQKEMIQMLNSI